MCYIMILTWGPEDKQERKGYGLKWHCYAAQFWSTWRKLGSSGKTESELTESASNWLDCGQVCMAFSWLMIGVEGVATHGQVVFSYTEIRLSKPWRTSQSASFSQGLCFSSYFQAPAWCPWKMDCSLQAKEMLSSPICLRCLSKQQETWEGHVSKLTRMS